MATNISIINGEYRKNGGTYTSSVGTVINGDIIQVRQTSSSSLNTENITTVTVGSYSTGYSVTTRNEVGNEEQKRDIQRNNCAEGYTGSTVTYIVPVNTFFAPTLEEANTLAINDINTNGQSWVNDPINGGTCVINPPTDAVGILVVDLYGVPSLNVIGFNNTAGVDPYQRILYTGVNFDPNDGTLPADCWALASDLMPDTTKWRFEFNIKRLLINYPAETSFTFIISGRALTGTTINGQYSLKGAGDGNMTMTGSIGAYVPSTEFATSIGITPMTGITIAGGADGTYGIGVGANMIIFTYDVATKAITASY